ncbi:MAG: hypothetical protein A4S15_00175 [Candidatus Raskinella chloraquaticus]|uniref:Uncharacterized protein n=1 Tax=Candidatus Raskinella chloraquaticus TaxID=1951219 RepID=A0A1W9I2L2_9HYPH|nr:MAG: hypothetical protein A4S15_00175 [Proteobacteria bacterium SG_bin8]
MLRTREADLDDDAPLGGDRSPGTLLGVKRKLVDRLSMAEARAGRRRPSGRPRRHHVQNRGAYGD